MAQHRATEVFYPESDGQPIAESEVHRNLLWDLISALSHWLEGRPDAHVSGSLLVYYVEGQPRHVICPDVFIAFDSHKRLLENYRTWRDGPFPQVVIELTSRSTRAEDEGRKRDLYERLGVLEYYLFDPHFDPDDSEEVDERALLSEPQGTGELWCYRRPLPNMPFGPAETVAPGEVLHSDLLGLGLRIRGWSLRLVDERAGALLPAPFEDRVTPKVAGTHLGD